MKKQILRVLGLVTVGILAISTASGLNITHNSGVTWIQWTWYNGTNITSISVDGTEKNITANFYILSDLKPSERHVISITDNNTTYTDEATTLSSPTPYYIVFIFLLLCFLLGIFIRVEHFSAFFSLLSAVLGIFMFKSMLLYSNTGLAIISLMLAVLSVIWLILAVISSIVKSRQEEEDWI